MMDVPVDNAASARTSVPEGLTLAEEEELRAELAKVTGRWSLSAGAVCGRVCVLGRKKQEPQEQGLFFVSLFFF